MLVVQWSCSACVALSPLHAWRHAADRLSAGWSLCRLCVGGGVWSIALSAPFPGSTSQTQLCHTKPTQT